MVVDIVLSGKDKATLAGAGGMCVTGLEGGVSYYSTGTDHPSLGTDGSFEIIGPFTPSDGTRQAPFVRIVMHGRWIYNTPRPSGPPAKGKPGAGITFSADTGTFTLDADLARVPTLVSGTPSR